MFTFLQHAVKNIICNIIHLLYLRKVFGSERLTETVDLIKKESPVPPHCISLSYSETKNLI